LLNVVRLILINEDDAIINDTIHKILAIPFPENMEYMQKITDRQHKIYNIITNGDDEL
jgi:hypothetical protein